MGGGLWNFDASSNLLKSKIPMLRVGGGRVGSWNFDAEFTFAKIQNSDVECWGGGAHGILMLSSNLLKSKIPMLGVGGGGLMEF